MNPTEKENRQSVRTEMPAAFGDFFCPSSVSEPGNRGQSPANKKKTKCCKKYREGKACKKCPLR